MKKILLTNRYKGEPLNIIKAAVPDDFELEILDKPDQAELIAKAGYADYFIASGRLKINSEVLANANKLKMIQRTGVGLDSLDLEAIKAKNIPVYVNRGVNADSVAEHTMLLILASLKRLPQADNETRSGVWKKQARGVKNRELRGRTVGLIGMGNIGRRVAKMLGGFDVDIIYYDAYPAGEAAERELKLKRAGLDELLNNSDIVSLHCPLLDGTRHIINSGSIEKMKDGAVIVNTARGGLIDEAALAVALKSGKLSYAGLDVYEQEPPGDSELFGLDNVIATPHIGGITYDSFYRMMSGAMRNIRLFDEGRLDEIEQYKI
ncbi:MAG: 2-hydroxyacid dehydrogenase [Clostridia bacterium]|nr:2-hydroxyacid dehydrogenase [Clostridia bacterium]